jgi:hypothetical protein
VQIDNKPHTIIRDNEKGTYVLMNVAISGDRNVIKKGAEKILKYKDLTTDKCDTSNNRGNWNHLNIIQKIPGQHTGKARNQGATENSHIGHCTHTSESTNVEVQYI